MKSSNTEDGWISVEHRFEPDHPSTAGHFPGNPLIPGALLLREVMRVLPGSSGGSRPREVRHAKFVHPVRPGDRLTIRWRCCEDGETRFEVLLSHSGKAVLFGTVKAYNR